MGTNASFGPVQQLDIEVERHGTADYNRAKVTARRLLLVDGEIVADFFAAQVDAGNGIFPG